MNKLEKTVYDFVKSNPGLKAKIRNTYRSLFDLLPAKKNFFVNEIEVHEGFFFGFHDITPFSPNDDYVLANNLTIPFRMPERGDVLEVGFFPFDKCAGKYIKVGESLAWNYHKGCRLQWVGKEDIIYNDTHDDNLVSRICDRKGNLLKTIPYPIDTVSDCGGFATSFSYKRLENLMPGYGYDLEDGSFPDEKAPRSTGMYLIDLKTGKRNLFVNLFELARLGKLPTEAMDGFHYVTHSLFSPDSRYVSFLHRAVNLHDLSKRWSVLVVYDRIEKKYYVSDTSGMVSHYVWNGKNQIIAYCRIGDIDSHILFEGPTLKKYQRVAYPRLNSDGHQSFIDHSTFVTDSYPDKYRMANLYKVEIEADIVTHLASVYSPKKYQSVTGKHWACDLHPRMNNKGNVVCFDSVFTGTRALCFMSI